MRPDRQQVGPVVHGRTRFQDGADSPKMLKTISVSLWVRRVPPQLWESWVNTLREGPSGQSSKGRHSRHWAQGGSRCGLISSSCEQADVKGHRGHTLVLRGSTGNSGSSSSGLARALLSLCFRRFLLVSSITITQEDCWGKILIYAHEFQDSEARPDFSSCFTTYWSLGCSPNALDAEHPDSIPRLHSPHSLPSPWTSHYLSLQPQSRAVK